MMKKMDHQSELGTHSSLGETQGPARSGTYLWGKSDQTLASPRQSFKLKEEIDSKRERLTLFLPPRVQSQKDEADDDLISEKGEGKTFI